MIDQSPVQDDITLKISPIFSVELKAEGAGFVVIHNGYEFRFQADIPIADNLDHALEAIKDLHSNK